MNTKLHAVTDANGRPISLFMTAGQVSDYIGAAAMLDSLPRAQWGAVRITKRSRKIPTLLIFRPRPPPTRHSLQRESNEVWVC